MMTKRKFKIWGNLILLIMAIFFLALAVEVKYASKSLDWVGANITKIYRWLHKHDMEDALEELANGNDKPSINLLRSWQDIRKGDRAYPFKRTVFVELAKHVHSNNRHKDLLMLSEVWLELDDRDITARAYFYEALRYSEDRSLEGEEGLQTEFYKFPKNKALQEFYLPLTEKYGDQEAYRSLIQKPAPATMLGTSWQIFWDVGKGFGTKTVKGVKFVKQEDNLWEAKLTVKDSVIRWRLDPPPNSTLRISNVSLLTNDSTCPIPLESLKLHDILIDGNELVTTGEKDPHLSFSSSVCGEGEEPTTNYRFQLKMAIDSVKTNLSNSK